MKCSFKRLIRAPPQTAWRLLTDLSGLPDRFPQFEGWTISADPRGSDLVSLGRHRRAEAGDIDYMARLTVLKPGRAIEVEYLERDLTPMGQTVRYMLETEQPGTRLMAVLDVEGIVGFVYMFLVVRQFLNRLKEVAEES